jgi:hypothetical protein
MLWSGAGYAIDGRRSSGLRYYVVVFGPAGPDATRSTLNGRRTLKRTSVRTRRLIEGLDAG